MVLVLLLLQIEDPVYRDESTTAGATFIDFTDEDDHNVFTTVSGTKLVW